MRRGTNAADYASGFESVSWAAYDEEFGGNQVAVTAALNTSTLTLTANSGAILADQYWVQVTASGKQPSDRLGLTVTGASGTSPQPAISNRLVLKEGTAATVDFVLDNAAAYTSAPVWAVYSDTTGTAAAGVSASIVDGKLRLSKTGDVPAGTYWVSADMGGAGESELAKITVATPLKLKSASIANSAPSTLVVEFAETVSSVDIEKFRVKVNTMPKPTSGEGSPYGSVAGNTDPWLDISMDTPRTITGFSGTGTTWNLTMSAPAQFGEIIRLATVTSGGASSAGAVLPKVPGLIVQNGVQLTRKTDWNTAGFYMYDASGIMTQPVSIGTADQFLKDVKSWLVTNKNTHPADGYTYVLSLGADQTLASDNTYFINNGSTIVYNGSQRSTFIVTTDTVGTLRAVTGHANAGGYALAFTGGGITIVIDKDITFTSANTESTGQYFVANNNGRIILNGGTLKNFANGGDSRGAIGGENTYFIMNSGTITNIKSQQAPVVTGTGGIFVMYDGTISDNRAHGSTSNIKAGGVGMRGNGHTTGNEFTATQHGSVGFYMTGGSITSNSIANLGTSSGAGGVLAAGEFQKTGGIIGSNTITAGGTLVNNKAANIVVLKVAGQNPGVGQSYQKAGISAATDTLFIDCVKPANGTAGTLSIPTWGATSTADGSGWD